MTEQTVLNYIEHLSRPRPLTTVERSTESKYQFYLLVRALKRRLKTKPIFIAYEKQKGYTDRIKAMLEEHSLFRALGPTGETDQLYALEGFPGSWVSKLALPPNTYVVAEVDDGDLKPETFGRGYNKRRDILKVLTLILETEREDQDGRLTEAEINFSLRELVKLDWSGLQRFEEFEPLLRKAQVMGWTEEQLGKELGSSERSNLLTDLKRSEFKNLYELLYRRGATSVYNLLIQNLAELIHYRSLRLMGFDEARTKRELEIRDWKAKDLEEAAKMLTGEDIRQMVERIVELDRLIMRTGDVGLQLLLLNAPIRVRK